MRARYTASSVVLVLAMLLGPNAAEAQEPVTPGVLPAEARVHGKSLAELASAYALWGFGTSAEVNPLVAARCERSPIHPRIWFLPVSFGGEAEATCHVPPGSFLVVTPGFIECSNIEPAPFYGADEAELLECVESWFEFLSTAEVILDGRPVDNLADYVVTTDPVTLPPNNLISADPGLSFSKGYFLAIPPLSRGTHTLRLYDEFEALGFKAGITITVVVG